MSQDKPIFELLRSDFPNKEPVLKMKRGLLWRHQSCGYTNDITEAQLYERNECLDYCFGKNGKRNGGNFGLDEKTLAIPIRHYLKNNGLSKKELIKKINILTNLIKYAE